MGKDNFSFDVVSEVDLQEVDNAINQARKEIAQRYDFKGSKSSIEFSKEEKKLILNGDDDYKLRALTEILAGKLVKRGISMKSLTFKDVEHAFSGTLRQEADITMGLSKEKAKELVKIIKETGLKVQTQIEGEKVRVFAPKKDDLQSAIGAIKGADFSLPLSFCNYR